MRAASASGLARATVLAALAWAGLAAAAPVPVPTALTGATLGGEVVGATPFLGPPAYDPIDGALLFRAALSRGSTPEAIFRLAAPGPAPALVAAAGHGALPGAVFTRFLRPAGCAGNIAFWAGLADAPGATAPADSGIFVQIQGQLLPAALVGDAAPGGGIITALGSAPGPDTGGRVTFLAEVDDGQALVLLRRSSAGSLTEILGPGTPADDGATVLQVLDAQSGCGAPLLARALLDTGAGPTQALLRQTAAGWETVLREADPLPAGGSAGTPRLPAAVRPDGSMVLVADRPGGAGQVLLGLDAGLSAQVLAAAGDSLAGGTLVAFGAPTSWDAGHAALLALLQPGQPANAPAREVVLATDGVAPPVVVVGVDATAPGGEPLDDLDTPAGDGAGHLAMRARSATGTQAGLLRISAAPDLWLALAGEPVAPWGRLLAGGLRKAGPALDLAGNAVFVATLPPGRDGEALFVAAPGEPPRRLLQSGDMLTSGAAVLSLEGPPATGAGGAVWLAARVDDAGGTLGYVRLQEGEPGAMVVAEGDPSPLGGTLRTLGRVLAATSSDRLVFTATLSQATASSAVLTYSPGEGLESLAAVGQAAPGGGLFAAFGFAPAAIGSTGAGFLAYTGGARSGSGIYHAAAAGAEPIAVALSGEPAPGGGLFAGLQEPVAGGGVMAFVAELDDGRIGVFRWDGAACQLLLSLGDVLPGGGSAAAVSALAVDGQGAVHAALQVAGAPWAAAVYDLQAGSGPLLRSGMSLPLEDGSSALLAGFSELAAAGSGLLAAGIDLGGWSDGAAVAHMVTDDDGDGWGDPIDCAVAQADAWRLPPTAGLGLRASGTPSQSRLAWSDLAPRAGPGTVHDLLGGRLSDLRAHGGLQDAACLAAGVPGGSAELSDGLPAAGDAFWYLVRGRNGCGSGEVGEAAAERLLSPALCIAP